MGRVVERARRLLVAGLLVAVAAVAVAAVSACQGGDADEPSAATPTSATPSTNVEQNRAAVCTLAVTAVGGVASTALPDATKLAGGQLSREEFGERLRPIFTTAGDRLRKLAPQTADPTLRAAIEGWAVRMGEGATAPDPVAFYTTTFKTLSDEVDTTCKIG
jgi:hypothetical protein